MHHRSILVVVAAVAGLGGGVVSALPAAASNPCGATGAFNGTNMCTYKTVGTDTFTVAPGVSSVSVAVVGAGGAGGTGGTGGNGAQVTTTLDVAGLSSLGVVVGGSRPSELITPPYLGIYEGGGGDPSAIDPNTSHRIVAGGGGGAGGGPNGNGGSGGINADGSGGSGLASPGGGPNGSRGCSVTSCGGTGFVSGFGAGAYAGGGGGYGGGAGGDNGGGGAGGSIDPAGTGYAPASNGGPLVTSGGNGSVVISWGTQPVVVDNQPPTVSVTLSSPNAGTPDGTNGWFKTGPVTGTVTADDTADGNSSIASITCTTAVNGASPQPLTLSAPTGIGTSPTTSGSFSIAAPGTSVIACTATDAANNTSTPATTRTVMLDSVAPTVTCPAPQPNFVLNQSDRNLRASASDTSPGSGPLAATVTGSVNTKTLGMGSVPVTSFDGAGNSTSVTCTYSVAAIVKVHLPANVSLQHGRSIRVAFTLIDANNKPIPDAIAMTANLQVSFSGGPAVKATYSTRAKTFVARVSISKTLATGTYSLSVTSNTASVPITPTTVSVKITNGRRTHNTITHRAK